MFEEALRTKESNEIVESNQNKDKNITNETENELQGLERSISS